MIANLDREITGSSEVQILEAKTCGSNNPPAEPGAFIM